MQLRSILLICAAGLLPGVLGTQSVTVARSYEPFTADIRTTYFDEHGNKKEFLKSFARRSDGSHAMEGETEAYGERHWFRFIFDAPGRFLVSVYGWTQAAHVTPLVEDYKFEVALHGYGDCRRLQDERAQLLGESELFGLGVVEVEYRHESGRVLRQWVAPRLACFALLELDFQDGKLVWADEVTAIRLGEPDPARFQIPSTFRVVTPAEQFRLEEKRYGGWAELNRSYFERLEREYQAAKPHWRGPFPLP